MKDFFIKKWRTTFLFLLAAALPLLLGGCGGNGSTPTFNISGNWNIGWTPAGASAPETDVFNFTQSDSDLSGTTSQGQVISGSINDLNVNFSFIWTEAGVSNTYTFNGTESANGTAMSGTWTNTSGAQGTWSGTFILP